MNPAGRDIARTTTRQKRVPPVQTKEVRVLFSSSGEINPELSGQPVDLYLETTDSGGELADWFHDEWWTDLLSRWAQTSITIYIETTPNALLHPVVIYEAEMLYRLAPHWRLVGHVYRDDVGNDDDVATLASSAYHEVRFIDEERPLRRINNRFVDVVKLEELFGRIRKEQARIHATRPALVRLPASKRPSLGAHPVHVWVDHGILVAREPPVCLSFCPWRKPPTPQ